MKVIYAGKNNKKTVLQQEKGDVLVLTFDNWDDYDYKTTFDVYCRIDGKRVDTGSIRILIDKEQVSYAYLDKLVKNGWSGEFPIPNTRYISVPNSLTFYQLIEGNLGSAASVRVAELLNDASFRVFIEDDAVSSMLTETEGFENSLMRERASQSAYYNTWKIFNDDSIHVNDLEFSFYDPQGELKKLDLVFNTKSLLPHDIHVLIGPNGVGKSQTLLQLVNHWLDLTHEDDKEVGFTQNSNINQIIIVSYSPFELFPVDTKSSDNRSGKRRDEEVYKYFGLRGREKVYDKSGKQTLAIRLSRNRPKLNAAQSLLQCLADDQKYGAIKDWSKKLWTMERVLKTAITFDHVAIEVKLRKNGDEFFNRGAMYFIDKPWVDSKTLVKLSSEREDGERFLIPVSADRIDALNSEILQQQLIASEGIVFLKDGEPVELSSGQRLFSYMVINILGTIRRNSLVLIDEPELFLHPTMEIAFITMLKDILASFRSKALLATHSLVTVRELPRDCVHVYEATKDGLFINHPPFETFGGDIQRISSYVFGDKSISKPFEAWITENLEKYGSADNLIDALGDNINEEMIIQISAMGASKW
ncbi:hypothetical protein P608_10325 [Comamonas thiooxydans]|uniref:ATPase AAA-type core domain-containing protein n=1 Tax=Comamonas thiooxydans TaxID=363952 RepID=A0A0E3BVC2_9BURK|nr:ATP-binding protein [Comamonas thiooxydans]KGH12737.1 hypothetical protein P608_10325 [Comamonas thiooxydans]KGH13784.1 hypothetical protein P607_23910 [Comamonas thiooxydans]